MLIMCVEKLGYWMGGRKEGRKEAKAGLRIAYSNQKVNLYWTRPVWTGFKIAVRPKLLTHYYKVRCLDTIIICNSQNKNYNWFKNMYQINKPKMVRILKFKILIILKLNFNGGQFYKKY